MLVDSEYQILDSGFGRKLEKFGPYTVIRPASQAIWSTLNPSLWQKADAEFIRNEKGNGEWNFFKKLPEQWSINILGISFIIKPTSFGHMGVFPEAYHNWVWLQNYISQAKKELQLISLFSYTGGYSLIPAKYGAHVCHVDASKSVVKWARDNAEASKLADKPIRWIIEDVRKFIAREIRRGSQYDAIIMDPPTYGRGSNGELWQIEKDLRDLMIECSKLLKPNPDFFMVNTYAGDITACVLKNILLEVLPPENHQIQSGEMLIPETNGLRDFPNGMTAVWYKK